jgi:hypothetical protein
MLRVKVLPGGVMGQGPDIINARVTGKPFTLALNLLTDLHGRSIHRSARKTPASVSSRFDRSCSRDTR